MSLSSLRFDTSFFQPLLFLRVSWKRPVSLRFKVVALSSPAFVFVESLRQNHTLRWHQPRITLFSIEGNERSWRIPVRHNLPVVLGEPVEVDVC